MPVGHECGLTAGASHHTFLNIFQKVFFASYTIFFGLVADHYSFVVGNATERCGKQFEIGRIGVLRGVFRGADAEGFIDGWPAECYFPLALGVIFRLAVGVVIGVILILFILEDV